MKRLKETGSAILTLGISMGLALLLMLLPTAAETAVYDQVVRLHILAEDDSGEAQALKLLVRDRILDYMAERAEEYGDRAEAAEDLRYRLPALVAMAEQTLADAGCDADVKAVLGQEDYPTRTYGAVSLPAGSYCSLRLEIGKAEGKNWWCVLFPPLCTKSAEASDTLAEVGFTGRQIRLLTDTEHPRYKLKFKILELVGGWFGNGKEGK